MDAPATGVAMPAGETATVRLWGDFAESRVAVAALVVRRRR